jgi:hypothetical protein
VTANTDPPTVGPVARPQYGDPTYRRARAAWAARVARGEVVCHLCGRQIAGPFHLDHVRGRPGVFHPAHPLCNLIEGGQWKGRKRLEPGSGRR